MASPYAGLQSRRVSCFSLSSLNSRSRYSPVPIRGLHCSISSSRGGFSPQSRAHFFNSMFYSFYQILYSAHTVVPPTSPFRWVSGRSGAGCRCVTVCGFASWMCFASRFVSVEIVLSLQSRAYLGTALFELVVAKWALATVPCSFL